MKDTVYFISDAHFGANPQDCFLNREQHFCNFLKKIKRNASHLFLLGDIFEFWMEYEFYIGKPYFKILNSLFNLAESDVEVHYLSGNHDFNLGNFFDRDLNIKTHHKPLKIVLQDKRLLLLHGDGIAKSDVKYRILKKILVHPLSNWAFKLIHPDWGMKLAKFVSSNSRTYYKPTNTHEYANASFDLLNVKDVDAVVHGHTHKHFVKEVESGIYINSGEWLKNLQYIELKNGNFKAKSYKPS